MEFQSRSVHLIHAIGHPPLSRMSATRPENAYPLVGIQEVLESFLIYRVLRVPHRNLSLHHSNNSCYRYYRLYIMATINTTGIDKYATVNIAGIDKKALLNELLESAIVPGVGPFMLPIDFDDAIEEAYCNNWSFDYVQGRPMKCDISGDIAYTWSYDRDNGLGTFQSCVDRLRV